MFKGIIEAVGAITKLLIKDNQIFLVVNAPELKAKVVPGSSVACNGACLTVTSVMDSSLEFYLSPETFQKTNFRTFKEGSRINLETSMKIGDTVDGHFVQGHVDTTTKITDIQQSGESHMITFALTKEISPYIAYKGSVCIDGTSLTVNGVSDDSFSVNIIPYTWSNTIFRYNEIGDEVNVESDLLARYLKRLLDQSQH
ncbi:riboflavin synthase, alpha subunit [Neorickettsia helminthoeca str. Oregon]|uniref:Riboflavin synthase n=1 Tax=Neorickettsia helminthoeca str. Oregon TaxID=1286528 RepID=X5HMN1_9RICK|nr:riboflavin synthase [Neorickettsia helminthoeca]AHX11735.1 riboflavin synthase, alpha subunit [Neorickettsia helminthoeca str. Oregon]